MSDAASGPLSGDELQAMLDHSPFIDVARRIALENGARAIEFIEVNSRNGFFLLAREPHPDFDWSHLAGKEVISFAEAPTPWQCMLTVLRRNGDTRQ